MFRSLYILTVSCSLLLVSALNVSANEDEAATKDPVSTKKQGDSHHDKQDHKKHGDTHADHIGVTDASNDDPGEISVDLMIYTGLIFLLLFLGLAKFAWGPIISAIDAREASVRNDIASAEDARLKAEKMLADHAAKLESVQDEVKEILAEARRDADQTKQDIITAAQTEATATKNRAVADIERARDQALEAVFDNMNETVAMATEHVVGHGLQPEDQSRLIDEALAQFASSHSS